MTIIRCLATPPRWVNAVERMRPSGARWVVRSVGDWQALVDSVLVEPHSFSMVEVTLGQAAHWIRRIAGFSRLSANHRIAVVAAAEIRPVSLVLREAGAVWVGTSLSQQHDLARLIERFAANFPPPQLPLREAVFASLPWTADNDSIRMESMQSPDQRQNPSDKSGENE